MQYTVFTLPVVPLRAGPSDRDEMTSQALFGEVAIILEEQQRWCFVEMIPDGYRGWVFKSMTTKITEETAIKIENSGRKYVGNLFLPVIENKGKYPLLIPAGGTLYDYKPASNSFLIGEQLYNCIQEPVFYNVENIREDITSAAMIFINAPYLWGGKNPFGIDCSGLTQIVMKMFGRYIPRDSRQQVEHGINVNFISEARAGDLAFFDNEEGEIIHTGIILKNQEIIHASGRVRVDRIDHQGIYDSSIRRYTHRLRVIKNILDRDQ